MTNLDEPTHGEYDGAVQIIKAAILRSQYAAARSVNEEQLKLYFGIGKYISLNSRKGFWGKGAIDAISEQLQRELPGLRGFWREICVTCVHSMRNGLCLTLLLMRLICNFGHPKAPI